MFYSFLSVTPRGRWYVLSTPISYRLDALEFKPTRGRVLSTSISVRLDAPKVTPTGGLVLSALNSSRLDAPRVTLYPLLLVIV